MHILLFQCQSVNADWRPVSFPFEKLIASRGLHAPVQPGESGQCILRLADEIDVLAQQTCATGELL